MNSKGNGVRTSPAGAPLMIIERIEQTLIMGVHRANALAARDAEAEESRHLVVDHSSAHGIEVTGRQNIQQGRAGDQAMITSAVGQRPHQCLDAAVDDHRVVRQRQ
ncbi:MAG TPA: hypothetical protein VFP81_01585 [Propionibacteriaceae bacterium]|nr:hypothetical protein [Propionibacteriaceae bacterium]